MGSLLIEFVLDGDSFTPIGPEFDFSGGSLRIPLHKFIVLVILFIILIPLGDTEDDNEEEEDDVVRGGL